MSRTIKIKIDSPLIAEYQWTLKLFSEFIGFDCEFVAEGEDILVAEHGQCDIALSHFFKNIYLSGDRDFKSYFRKEPLHFAASGKPDHLSTCYYLANYVQEYTDYHADKHGRFPYEKSLQHHFNCVEKNLVADYFIALYEQTPRLKNLVKRSRVPSRYFLTHDIDSVYGALGENYKHLIKTLKPVKLLQLIFNHYIGTPDYLLLDKIMKIEDEYDMRSVFFWIVNSGRGTRLIKNADYEFDAPAIKKVRTEIEQHGSFNGLHKSAGRDSFKNEVKKFGGDVKMNRNHYLITELPDTFNELESNKIKIDSSMGFPDAIGFRNNYGLPLHPFSIDEKRAYDLLEVPLTIMDTSLRYYMNKNSLAAEKYIVSFLERNKENAVLTILWHNNYFFDIRDPGWIDCYKRILGWFRENNIRTFDHRTI